MSQPIIPLYRFTFVFIKFYLRSKARLVVGGNMTISSDNDSYCGEFNVKDVSRDFLLWFINNLEVDVSYVWNVFLHGFSNENIYSVAVSRNSETTDFLTKPLVSHNHSPLMKESPSKSILWIYGYFRYLGLISRVRFYKSYLEDMDWY